jgi:hypothetical protein
VREERTTPRLSTSKRLPEPSGERPSISTNGKEVDARFGGSTGKTFQSMMGHYKLQTPDAKSNVADCLYSINGELIPLF